MPVSDAAAISGQEPVIGAKTTHPGSIQGRQGNFSPNLWPAEASSHLNVEHSPHHLHPAAMQLHQDHIQRQAWSVMKANPNILLEF